ARVAERPRGHDPLKLAEGDRAPRERHRADHEREKRRQGHPKRRRAAPGAELARELEDRHERRSTAARAVEQRDHLRHRGHLDHPRAGETGDAADEHPRDDHRHPALHVLREERGDDRNEHPRRRDAVAHHRRRGRGEALQPEDEGVGRDDEVIHAAFSATSFLVCSCTTSPSLVITVPLMTSSVMSRFSLPSLVIIRPSRLATFREYIWLAWYGMVDGRLVVPSM